MKACDITLADTKHNIQGSCDLDFCFYGIQCNCPRIHCNVMIKMFMINILKNACGLRKMMEMTTAVQGH